MKKYTHVFKALYPDVILYLNEAKDSINPEITHPLSNSKLEGSFKKSKECVNSYTRQINRNWLDCNSVLLIAVWNQSEFLKKNNNRALHSVAVNYINWGRYSRKKERKKSMIDCREHIHFI